MSVWYNEIDTFAAAWLRELIADGLIADGEVDERSILDVRPDDLRGFTQCHFFAGIGGWSRALRLAGWPDDRPVWTGSCPCQPLSVAGQRKGHADSRHLWPAFHDLIAVCQPATVFGEQVASKLGREWLAGVRADLESSGYACGGADLCAAGVGAPHIRQRLWWVGHAKNERRDGRSTQTGRERQKNQQEQRPGVWGEFGGHGEDSGLADASSQQWGPNGSQPDAEANGGRHAGRNCKVGGLADANHSRPHETGANEAAPKKDGPKDGLPIGDPILGATTQPITDFWDGDYIPCADGKARRIEPGIFPLADGVSNRVGTLRGAGNAIVPQVAGEFVKAFMETT
jgi:DNA (cytosine-5)-methyltransferase 1